MLTKTGLNFHGPQGHFCSQDDVVGDLVFIRNNARCASLPPHFPCLSAPLCNWACRNQGVGVLPRMPPRNPANGPAIKPMAGDRDQPCITGGIGLLESSLPALSTWLACHSKERLAEHRTARGNPPCLSQSASSLALSLLALDCDMKTRGSVRPRAARNEGNRVVLGQATSTGVKGSAKAERWRDQVSSVGFLPLWTAWSQAWGRHSLAQAACRY